MFGRSPFFRSLITRTNTRHFFLSFFTFPCLRSFLLFNRAAGFLPPQPHFTTGGARRACQGWPLFAATVRLGLYMTEHDGKLAGLGRKSASIGSGLAIRECQSLPVTSFSSRSRGTRRIMGHRRFRRRNVPNGITEVSRKKSRGRRDPSRQGRRFAMMAKAKLSPSFGRRRPLERLPRGPHAMQDDGQLSRNRHRGLL